jgi:hypothetical protein
MTKKPMYYAIASGVSGVLGFSILILDWGATPPQPTFWYFFFLILAAVMATASLILAKKAENASVGEGKTGGDKDNLRFWIRLGRVGSVIVIIWLGLLVIGFVVTSIGAL